MGGTRTVVSGHAHQYRDLTGEGVRHVWVPSTAFYLPDEIQGRVGAKVAARADAATSSQR